MRDVWSGFLFALVSPSAQDNVEFDDYYHPRRPPDAGGRGFHRKTKGICHGRNCS